MQTTEKVMFATLSTHTQWMCDIKQLRKKHRKLMEYDGKNEA